jgi:Spy/CpxP family protein refolding chaperone
MKKKIIVGLLMVSALSFGAINNNSGNTNSSGQRGFYHTQMMDNLSEKQQTELTEMMQDRREANYKKSLDMRSKQLELEKLLAEDKVNWKSVERVNKQISDMKAKQRLDGMKFRSNIEDKYGISMGHKGIGSNCGSTGGKHMNNGHMGNGMNNGKHMNGGIGHRNN